jgi:hypothetical protein
MLSQKLKKKKKKTRTTKQNKQNKSTNKQTFRAMQNEQICATIYK